jgi:hypothetical protein
MIQAAIEPGYWPISSGFGGRTANFQELENVSNMRRELLPLCFLVLSPILSGQPQIPYLELNNLWRLVPDGHYMSSSLASERSAYTSDGLLYYTASTNAPGTVPLYRHFNGSTGDHTDSLNESEPGYTTDGILGYIWTSPSSFLNATPYPITGVSDGSYHATIKSDETLSGYSGPTSFGYGLYRYNLDLLSLLSLSAGALPSNRMAWRAAPSINGPGTARNS